MSPLISDHDFALLVLKNLRRKCFEAVELLGDPGSGKFDMTAYVRESKKLEMYDYLIRTHNDTVNTSSEQQT